MILLNGKEVQFEQFPNGETRLASKSLNISAYNKISFKYEDDSDLVKLMFLKNYLDDVCYVALVDLIILYMPYSRMDRSENGSPFTLKYVSNFINNLNFSKIKVIEPHSDVTCALLDRAEAKYINFDLLPKVMKDVGFDKEIDYIVFPDATANKRYGNVKIPNQLTGIKHRNFNTGKIESLELAGKVHHKGFKALLVDDLCSFGGTFLLTAEKLKELGASEIYLLVGHCENSIFKGNVLKTGLIDKVFTTDSILSNLHEKIKIFKVDDIIG